MNLPGIPVTPADQTKILNPRWVDGETAAAAMLRRVDSTTGGQLIGRNGSANYAGIAIPYFLPGECRPREYRIRRDEPELEYKNGVLKECRKYMSPPGSRNLLYFNPTMQPELLKTATLPILITESEIKSLALGRLAHYKSATPLFVAVGLSGVWNFTGNVGKVPGPDGGRRNVKGPIADLDRIAWQGRNVVVAFDSDVDTNNQVHMARASLARELRSRGAKVAFLEWDISKGKGVDDYISTVGPEAVLAEIAALNFEKKDWQANLIRSSRDDNPRAIFANAVTALREAPEFGGLLAFGEFSMSVTCTRQTPWGTTVAEWSDQEDRLTADWLQHRGIFVTPDVAGQAVQTVAKDQNFHPVKNYLSALEWDGIKRLEIWPSKYLGVPSNNYTAAVGAKWLISAVARIYEPGIKADCCLILEGAQGTKKSTALRVLGGEFFSDEIADLGSKDAAMQTQGVWILEIAELDSMSRAEVSKIKGFMSRGTDRFRPPYGKRVIESPRQCVFSGSINHSEYLRDATGGRRFWPIACGAIDIDGLRSDRDQLWAEAVVRYRAGETWWLDTAELNQAAEEEQEDRFDSDPWAEPIREWLPGHESVSIPEVLSMLGKPREAWNPTDKARVGRSLRSMRWEPFKSGPRHAREWRFRPVSMVSTVEK